MGLSVEPNVALRRISALPPEEVFLSWLIAQTEGTNLAAAADIELDRLSRYAGRHPGPRKLAELFKEFRYCVGVDPAAQ